jgi:hypothetical protein
MCAIVAAKQDYTKQRVDAIFKSPGGSTAGRASGPRAFGYFFLGGTTASLNALAKRNFTTVLAGILIGSPV